MLRWRFDSYALNPGEAEERFRTAPRRMDAATSGGSLATFQIRQPSSGHVCTSVSLLERHSLRSHSGYTRARHPVTLFHGNEATLPSPHHKDQPGSHALSTLGCTRKIQKHTRAHRTLTQTHTHAQRTALHVRDRNPTAEGTPWVAHEGLQPLDPLCEELLHSATRYEAAPARRRCSSSQALDPRLPRGTREPFGSETLHH